jgi:hypothetical protein
MYVGVLLVACWQPAARAPALDGLRVDAARELAAAAGVEVAVCEGAAPYRWASSAMIWGPDGADLVVVGAGPGRHLLMDDLSSPVAVAEVNGPRCTLAPLTEQRIQGRLATGDGTPVRGVRPGGSCVLHASPSDAEGRTTLRVVRDVPCTISAWRGRFSLETGTCPAKPDFEIVLRSGPSELPASPAPGLRSLVSACDRARTPAGIHPDLDAICNWATHTLRATEQAEREFALARNASAGTAE